MKKLILAALVMLNIPAWSQQAEPLIFREKTYDFGEIDEGKGNTDYEFVFTNNSGRPVKILSVQASCGCTTPGWTSSAISQGKTGFIKVSFDPKGRPGYFNKSLTVLTDLDANPVILQIKGQVVGQVTPETDDYPAALGNLRFKTRSFNMGTIFINKEAVQKKFPVINVGTVPMKFLGLEKPPYLKVETPAALAPQEKGVIKVMYDANLKNQFGFTSDNIQFATDDAGEEIKSISVFATLEEYYPINGPDEIAKAPVLLLKEQSVDLGRFRQGARIDRAVTVQNGGKKDLQIKALQGNCDCISAEVEKKIIRPGDSTVLRISFSPQNREGTQQKAITLYSNDPRNAVQRINVIVYIEN